VVIVLDIRPEFDAHCGTTVHLASEHTFARVNPYHVKEKGTITLIQECVGRYARHCGVLRLREHVLLRV